MEPRVGPAEEVSDETFVRRFRLAVCCLVLAAVAILQEPGRIVSDTKIDLVVDPGAFLTRSLTLWDPNGAFGQVQNQAYGYLFPMGPFFWLGHVVEIEPWLVQRLWWALIFIVAFLGFVKLMRELGIGSGWSRIAGAFAYALSPRVLSVIGSSSIETWPSALAPWVLVALVIGSTRRSPIAMAALSALAVGCVGGVNAAATFAVIPLGALWLLMSSPGPRRRKMLLWWPVFVVLATLWWLIPLFLLNQYSPPFLDYIENAPLTTFAANLLDGLRGTSNWTAYLSNASQAGNQLITSPILICNVIVVTVIGLVGLARRDNPHRTFLFVGLLLGITLVTAGHTASHGGLAAENVQDLLDGVLAPLRNTHKFDVIVRVVVAAGFVHLFSVVLRTHKSRSHSKNLTPALGIAVLAVAGLVGSTAPAWAGGLPNRGSFTEVPDYWNEASNWISEHSAGDGALLVPASTFATYNWGALNDEPLQALATSPWTVRNAIPLAPAGNIRTLDAIESRFSDVRGSRALADYMANSGVGLLVVRNDLKASRDGLDSETVYSTIRSMPGVEPVASFGPLVGGKPRIESKSGVQVFIDQGWQTKHRAIEVFRVWGSSRLRAQATSTVPIVIGSPDSQIALAEAGMLRSPSVIFANHAEPTARPKQLVLTDGQRRQEVAFGRTHDNRSGTLTRDESYVADRAVHDYEMTDADRWATVPRLDGARKITASSAGSWVNSSDSINKGQSPWSAFDGDRRTSWSAGTDDIGKRSWIEIDFGKPVDVSEATVTVDGDPVESIALSVETDNSQTTIRARGRTPMLLGKGVRDRTSKLKISGVSSADDLLSIAEIRVPTVQLSRPLVLPEIPTKWGSPQRILLAADSGFRSGCLEVEGYLRCAEGADAWGEDGRKLDREFGLPEVADYPVRLRVRPIGGAALDELMQKDQLVEISASSRIVQSAPGSAFNAIDGDNRTAWVAGGDEGNPRLTVKWVGKKRISSIVAKLDRQTAASRPTRVTLTFSDGSSQKVALSANGTARFEPVRTDQVEIRFDQIDKALSLSSDGRGGDLPVGVSELTIGDTSLVPRTLATTQTNFACGTGPTVTIDDRKYESAVTASPAKLKSGSEVDAKLCGLRSVRLERGNHRISVDGSPTFRPVHLMLGEDGTKPSATVVTDEKWTAVERAVKFAGPSTGQTLTVTQNTNPGWKSRGGSSQPRVINGWQQGRSFGSGKNVRELVFAPNIAYRRGLATGGLSFLLLLAISVYFWSRGRADEVVRERRGRRYLKMAGVTTTGVALLAVGGLLGLLAGAVGALLGIALHRVCDAAVGGGIVVGLVGLVSAFQPWGGSSNWIGQSDWPQLAIACAFGSMAASVFGRNIWRKPFSGRST